MTQLFGVPIDKLTDILWKTTIVIVALVVLLALSNLIFFKIGVRNIRRRIAQMLLITFALMLSTTLLSSVLATGDVITAAVQSVAVYNLGSVDETIEGGHGDPASFSDGAYYILQQRARHDPNIAAIGAAFVEPDLLLADITSREVRSKVTGVGVIPGSEQGFGGMQNDTNTKQHFTIAQLHTNDIYVNHTLATLLNAHAGDTIYLYSQRWPQRRYPVHVVGIVTDDGLIGQKPYILTTILTFRTIENRYDDITHIYIANRNGGGQSDVDRSDAVTARLEQLLPGGTNLRVHEVKQEGVQVSQSAEEIFSRIFALFCLFALAIGLLLIFLIFVLLAAERRVEMGMARAIGVQRRHLILMFLFEGAVYDLFASLIGLAFGLAIGAGLVYLLGPTLARFNFPLKLTFQPHSLIIAYCLGVIFTFASVVLSSWLVSRMTIVEAMHDAAEPMRQRKSLGAIGVQFLSMLRDTGKLLRAPKSTRIPAHPFLEPGHPQGDTPTSHGSASPTGSSLVGVGLAPTLSHNPTLAHKPAPAHNPTNERRGRSLRRILFEQLPDTLMGLVRSLTTLGFLPLLAGYWCMQKGLADAQIAFFSLGLSLIVLGAALLLRAAIGSLLHFVTARLLATSREEHVQEQLLLYEKSIRSIGTKAFVALVGLAIVAYWALPFDTLANLGLPRFQGGIEIFFLAGLMMVLGTVWVLITNAEVFIRPLLSLLFGLPGLPAIARLASAYPLQRRFRTGLSVVMFSLVVFAMTVMAIITNAMQDTYTNIDLQTGGYDIQAVTYFKSVPNLPATLAQHGVNPQDFSAIGVRSSTVVGAIQLDSEHPGWRIYPAQVVNGGFLQGYGLQLSARAQGFANDAAIWQALQTHPNDALIDSSALPYRPNSILNSPVYDPNAPLPADVGASTQPPGFDANYTFALSGIYQGDTNFPAKSIWVTDAQHANAVKLNIIGVVDNSDDAHFGLYISRAAYDKAGIDPTAPIEGLPGNIASSDAFQTTYYFKVAPGQDKNALALALGSAYLDNGMETTVLADAIWSIRGPRIFLSNILLGIVGLTLLLGVAALAITGTRAVIERRQQIGMLRALGCSRLLIQGAFLCESFFVGALGCILGVTLGLILARNIFAANFFEQYQTGLSFSVPWQQLATIVGIALLAAFLGALLPAWQSGRVAPADAIRYT